MRKEGKINYDFGKIVRILIIVILIVLILIIGSLIYVFMSGDEEGNLAPVNLSNKNFIVENSVCKSAKECTELAVTGRNMSVCDYIERSSPLPYTYAGCFNKVAKELNGNGE